MDKIEEAIKSVFEKLSHDELVNFALELTVEGLRSTAKKQESADKKKLIYRRTLAFTSRQEAEDVIRNLENTCIEYGEARIADLYLLMDIPVGPNDNDWGWTSLKKAYIQNAFNRYVLYLPPVVRLT